MSCPLCEDQSVQSFHEYEDRRYGVRHYWRCGQCRLIFLDPKHHLRSEEEKARYATHQNHPDDERYVEFLSRLANPLSERLVKDDVGLDFGCGPGPTMQKILNDRGFSVENYDPFFFPDKTLLERDYDFIVCSETIEHFFNPRQEFSFFHQRTRPTGRIALMTQVLESEQDFPDWWYHRDPTHVCFYQQATFQWIARWLGWAVEYPSKNVVIYTKSD